MEGICMNVVNPDQFFSIPQGTLPWQPILGKIGMIPIFIYFLHFVFKYCFLFVFYHVFGE